MSPEYYPEVIDAGSLAAAMERKATLLEITLESLKPGVGGPRTAVASAQVGTARGTVRVTMARDARYFGLTFDSSRGFVWGHGGSDDLGEIVSAVNVWQGGGKVSEMRQKFAFLEFPDMSLAYEEGTHVAAAWSSLLSQADGMERRRLLEAVKASDRVTRLFPFFSHDRLVLAFDAFNKGNGDVDIDQVSDGGFSVALSDGSSRPVEVDAAHLVGVIESLLDRGAAD